MNKAQELRTMLKAVDRMAAAMKKKLRKKAREGRAGGLDPANRDRVAELLGDHVDRLIGGPSAARFFDRPDPAQAIDVANLAMMLWAMPTPADHGEPCVVLSKSGQKTDKPKVHISLHSKNGNAGIMTCDDTEQGNAQVKMYSDTYAHILGIPVIDRR